MGQNSFEFVEFYTADGLEMSCHLLVTLQETGCMVTVNSYHGLEMYVFVCNLEKFTIVCAVLALQYTAGTNALESKALQPNISARLYKLLYTTEQCK